MEEVTWSVLWCPAFWWLREETSAGWSDQKQWGEVGVWDYLVVFIMRAAARWWKDTSPFRRWRHRRAPASLSCRSPGSGRRGCTAADTPPHTPCSSPLAWGHTVTLTSRPNVKTQTEGGFSGGSGENSFSPFISLPVFGFGSSGAVAGLIVFFFWEGGVCSSLFSVFVLLGKSGFL